VFSVSPDPLHITQESKTHYSSKMTESAPLLADIDEEAPRIVEAQSDHHDRNIPASAYFRPLFKKLATTSLVLSILTIPLLITIFVIFENAPVRYWTSGSTQSLAKWMCLPLVISGLSVIFNFPILLNLIMDVEVLTHIIPRVVNLFDELPPSNLCRWHNYPGEPPIRQCLHWKLVITILIGISAGFTILVCILYVVQFLLRGIAIFKTKLWTRPLSSVLPREVTISFSMRVLRQEGERAEGPGNGPVYLS